MPFASESANPVEYNLLIAGFLRRLFSTGTKYTYTSGRTHHFRIHMLSAGRDIHPSGR
jgi:hypothetical protein